jgi:hypothetical protein
MAAEPLATFTAKPSVKTDGVNATISFAVSAPTDVEVAILDAKGVVVRHLAAGVLGATKAPPAPLKPGLAQNLEWDGRDDYGDPLSVNGEQLSVNSGPSATGHRSPITHILSPSASASAWA